MKKLRVKLLKQAREDSEKFREWKIKKEKEICQLKMQVKLMSHTKNRIGSKFVKVAYSF